MLFVTLKHYDKPYRINGGIDHTDPAEKIYKLIVNGQEGYSFGGCPCDFPYEIVGDECRITVPPEFIREEE